MIPSGFETEFVDAVKVRRATGNNVWGRSNAVADVTPEVFYGRVVQGATTLRTDEGREVRGTVRIWIDPAANLTTDDHIELADGSTPRIVGIATYDDVDLAHQVVVGE